MDRWKEQRVHVYTKTKPKTKIRLLFFFFFLGLATREGRSHTDIIVFVQKKNRRFRFKKKNLYFFKIYSTMGYTMLEKEDDKKKQIEKQERPKAVKLGDSGSWGYGALGTVAVLVLIIGGITAVVYAAIGMSREYKFGTWGTNKFGNGTTLIRWDNPIFFMLVWLLILSFFPVFTPLAWIVFGIICFYRNAPAVKDKSK